MLHRLYNSPLDESALYKIASKIGADVPFCMKKGISTTHGIGDVFSPCERLPECYFVIACAGEGVSTPWAYKRLDEMYDFSSREVSSNEFTEALKGGELLEIAGKMRNIFESAVLPERVMAQKIRDMLIDGGAINAMMSGSGPSVFGVFDKEEAANEAADQLLASGIAAHICKPYYPA